MRYVLYAFLSVVLLASGIAIYDYSTRQNPFVGMSKEEISRQIDIREKRIAVMEISSRINSRLEILRKRIDADQYRFFVDDIQRMFNKIDEISVNNVQSIDLKLSLLALNESIRARENYEKVTNLTLAYMEAFEDYISTVN